MEARLVLIGYEVNQGGGGWIDITPAHQARHSEPFAQDISSIMTLRTTTMLYLVSMLYLGGWKMIQYGQVKQYITTNYLSARQVGFLAISESVRMVEVAPIPSPFSCSAVVTSMSSLSLQSKPNHTRRALTGRLAATFEVTPRLRIRFSASLVRDDRRRSPGHPQSSALLAKFW